MIKKKFTKSDLRTGMIVEDRDGSRSIVMLNCFGNNMQVDVITSSNSWDELCEYKEDLTNYSHKELDIIKIYQICNYKYIHEMDDDVIFCIWERKEENPILTLDGVEYSESTLRSLIKKATE